MTMKRVSIASVLALALVLSSAPLHALPLDFGVIAPTAGTITYPVLGGPLKGINIQVDNIVNLPGGTPVACIGCVLNFTTGAAGPNTATTWTFGGGTNITAPITITGGVDLIPGGPLEIPLGTTLLTGHFGNVTVTAFGSTFKIAGSSFFDTKDPDLLAFFGLPNVDYVGNFNISFNAAGLPPSTFTSSQVLSGDILNDAVPEPGTLMLLGSGLTGLAFLAIRRRKTS